eukprot:274861-Prymnesium_polylepis.2
MAFWVLGPNVRCAYLRVARDIGVPTACWNALRHTRKGANNDSHAQLFPPHNAQDSSRALQACLHAHLRRLLSGVSGRSCCCSSC